MIKSRRMRWAGHVARMGEARACAGFLVGKHEGKPRRSWEDNIKMDFEEVGRGTDWIDVVQSRDRLL